MKRRLLVKSSAPLSRVADHIEKTYRVKVNRAIQIPDGEIILHIEGPKSIISTISKTPNV